MPDEANPDLQAIDEQYEGPTNGQAIAESDAYNIVESNAYSIAAEKEKIRSQKLRNDHLQAGVAQAKQDMAQRKHYANRIFIMLAWWLAFIAFALLVQGHAVRGFYLSDPVLLALIGSTTASVISIFLIVARYLFPDKTK